MEQQGGDGFKPRNDELKEKTSELEVVGVFGERLSRQPQREADDGQRVGMKNHRSERRVENAC